MCSIGPSCLLFNYPRLTYLFTTCHMSVFLIRSTGCLKKTTPMVHLTSLSTENHVSYNEGHFRQKSCIRLVSHASVRLKNQRFFLCIVHVTAFDSVIERQSCKRTYSKPISSEQVLSLFCNRLRPK